QSVPLRRRGRRPRFAGAAVGLDPAAASAGPGPGGERGPAPPRRAGAEGWRREGGPFAVGGDGRARGGRGSARLSAAVGRRGKRRAPPESGRDGGQAGAFILVRV